MDKASDLSMRLSISCCVSGSTFCKLIEPKEVLHPYHLQNYHDSAFLLGVLLYLMVHWYYQKLKCHLKSLLFLFGVMPLSLLVLQNNTEFSLIFTTTSAYVLLLFRSCRLSVTNFNFSFDVISLCFDPH